MANTPYYVKAETDALIKQVKRQFGIGIVGTVTPNVSGIPQINGVDITENGFYFIGQDGDYGTVTGVSVSDKIPILEVTNIETTAVYNVNEYPITLSGYLQDSDKATEISSGNTGVAVSGDVFDELKPLKENSKKDFFTVPGKSLSRASGAYLTVGTNTATDFIPIKGSTQFIVENIRDIGAYSGLNFYDENEVFLEPYYTDVTTPSGNVAKLTVLVADYPIDAVYIKATGQTTQNPILTINIFSYVDDILEKQTVKNLEIDTNYQNLFKNHFTIEGKSISRSTGAEYTASTNSATDFILVEDVTSITVTGRDFGDTSIITYYDENKNDIEPHFASDQTSNLTITVLKSDFPTGTKYIRCSAQTADVNKKVVGNIYDYVKDVEEKQATKNLEIDTNTVNLTNVNENKLLKNFFTISGKSISRLYGTEATASTNICTDFILVDEVDSITVKGRDFGAGASILTYYDENKDDIQPHFATSQDANLEITVLKSTFPVGTKYVRCSAQIADADKKVKTNIFDYVTQENDKQDIFITKNTDTTNRVINRKKHIRFNSINTQLRTTDSYTLVWDSSKGRAETQLEHFYNAYDALVTTHSDYITKIDCKTDSGVTIPSYISNPPTAQADLLDDYGNEYPLFMYKFSPPRVNDESVTKVFMVSGIHAEAVGMQATLEFIKVLCTSTDEDIQQLFYGIELYLIPCLSPTSSILAQRPNVNGVDLNRNLPTSNWFEKDNGTDFYTGTAAGNQYETQVLMHYISEIEPDILFDNHNSSHDGQGSQFWIEHEDTILSEAIAREIVPTMTRLLKADDINYPDDRTTLLGKVTKVDNVGKVTLYGQEQGITSMTTEGFNKRSFTNGSQVTGGDVSTLSSAQMVSINECLIEYLLKRICAKY